jgi:hypothetical protein
MNYRIELVSPDRVIRGWRWYIRRDSICPLALVLACAPRSYRNKWDAFEAAEHALRGLPLPGKS